MSNTSKIAALRIQGQDLLASLPALKPVQAAAIDLPRAKKLSTLLGISLSEAADTSAKGRANIIAKLEAARLCEITRGEKGSWLYDVNRHLSLCAILRRERESFEAAA